MRLDIDIFLGTHIVVAVSALDDPRLPLHFLESFREKRRVVYVHINAGMEILLTQCLDSFQVLFCHNKASLCFLLKIGFSSKSLIVSIHLLYM